MDKNTTILDEPTKTSRNMDIYQNKDERTGSSELYVNATPTKGTCYLM